MANGNSGFSVIGTSPTRLDGVEKVCGLSPYSIIVQVPGMLHTKVLRSRLPHARLTKVDASRAEEYIFENAAKPITISDLVRLSDISGRSQFRAFKEYRGYSPMAFLLATRLQRVRETLLAGEVDTTVTHAALDWGFSHLSRFSAEYAKRFGEKPSETLRKARGLR